MSSTKRSGPAAPPFAAGEIPSLDGLRAASILIVFLSHAWRSGPFPGGFGVELFFFLSGFLITTLLGREFDAHGRIAFRAFYARRALRLGPPLLLTLILAAGLGAAGAARADFELGALASQILFYHNYHLILGGEGIFASGLSVLWSLAVEEHFYLVWPLMFLLIARGRLGGDGGLRAVALLLAAFLAWRAVKVLALGAEGIAITHATDTRFDSILYGALLALMQRSGAAARLFPDAALPRLALTGGALALLLASFAIRDPLFRDTLRYTIRGLALLPLFHYAVSRPRDLWHRPLNWGPARRLGLWSYTVYLVHVTAIEAIRGAGIAQDGAPLLIVLAGALSCLWAAAVHRFVEAPLKPLRARLGHAGAPKPGAAAAAERGKEKEARPHLYSMIVPRSPRRLAPK